jgi:hypothetical protein
VGPRNQKKTRKAKEQTDYTPQQIYGCDFFELAIHAFDIQSGWRDAYQKQCEYTRIDLFMGKLNPEKLSQRMQDLNKIPIERTTLTDKTKKAYGKSLPEDEIRSIMGRAIPPEWTVNLVALGKEPWRFNDLEDQLNMYHQQWQADQQKHSLQRRLERCQANQMMEKEKIMKYIIIIQMVAAEAFTRAIIAEDNAEDAEGTKEVTAEEAAIIVSI